MSAAGAAAAPACLSCHQRPARTADLCAPCFALLPPVTSARLRQRDHAAAQRLLQLLSALHRGKRLSEIEVSA